MLTKFLRSNFHHPLRHNLSGFSFCTLPAINFADYTRLYRRQVTPEEFEFTLNSGTDRITFELPGTVTVGDLKQKVREFSQDIKDIKALSLDLAEYSDLIKISDLGKETHYLILNNENLIKVRSLELTEVDKAEMEYERKEEACMDCGLPFIEQQIIMNYLKRVDVLNKATLGKKLFADSDLYEGKINKKIIIQNLLDGIVMDKNHLVTNEKELLDYYYQLRAKASELEAQKELLEKKAYRITKLKMSLGLTVLFSKLRIYMLTKLCIGQLAFVGIGTYSVYSWDIIEPIAYFIGLLGSIILSGLYFRLYRDYSHHGIMKHLSEKELDKILKKQKEFSLEELQRLKDEIELVEKRIKTNILIDL